MNLEDGIAAIIQQIETVTDNPVLVAVYGLPNSGKSYTISRLSEYFQRNGKESFGYN